ncbi:MAG: transglycosylase domain-containing protein [Acidimicrobiales bacterium]
MQYVRLVAAWLFRATRLGVALFVAAVAFALTLAVFLPQVGAVLTANDSAAAEVDLDVLARRSLVFDKNGELIGQLTGPENREVVTLAQISDEAIETILAVEDAEFYRHNGVNIRAIVRAFIRNVESGSVDQGGSTITQQLIKNGVLSADQDLLERKVPEAALAIRLENQMEKDEILERYLNTVYFGAGSYGVQAAAETYFGVDASQLDHGQAAMLASLISSPTSGDPTRNPEVATERRKRALERLVELDVITEEEMQAYDQIPVPRTRRVVADEFEDTYFLEEVKQALLDAEYLGESYLLRKDAVFGGGLRVYTTFDPIAQALAEEAVNQNVTTNDLGIVGATASVEPGSGAIRSMVGGPGFEEFRFNIATQKGRPTGSSFKTFVLATAMEAGYVPDDQIDGVSPCEFENTGGFPDPYRATNFGGSGGSVGTVRSQTLSSSNCAYLNLGQVVGLQNVAETANALGVTTELDPQVISMPLGPFDITPLDMATAYATIANDGIRVSPYLIDRVTDAEGNVIYDRSNERTVRTRAISVQSARLVTSVLEANVRGGTGTAAGLDDQPAAGKTGTGQSFYDAWFVGFTPYLATAVWMGNPEEQVAMRGVFGRSTVTGGSVPATIWGQLNRGYHSFLPRLEFAGPESTRPGERILSQEEQLRLRNSLRSPCGGEPFEIDINGDGNADICVDAGGLPYLGECPALMQPFDTDNDGELDTCLAVAPPPPPTVSVAPTSTTEPTSSTQRPPPPTSEPPPPTSQPPPTTEPPPPTTEPPPPTSQPPDDG